MVGVNQNRPAGQGLLLLLRRNENFGKRGAAGSYVLDVADNANDLAGNIFFDRIVIEAQTDLLPERIFVRKDFACERVIDDDDRRSAGVVTLIDESAPTQRNAKNLEEAGSAFHVSRKGPLLFRHWRSAEDRKGEGAVDRVRSRCRAGNCFDTG